VHVTFVSTNRNKFLEVEAILSEFGIEADYVRAELAELQSDSLETIATQKAKSAYDIVQKPVIVEDDGLYVDSLNGFPGSYSAFVYKTIGNAGILKLLSGSNDRAASFRSVVAHFDGSRILIAEGVAKGTISGEPNGGGWGYDPIFVPEGSALTFGQLGEDKNKFSHRRRGLENFARNLLART
jgi:XTP/dITP diphosphohydrolase